MAPVTYSCSGISSSCSSCPSCIAPGGCIYTPKEALVRFQKMCNLASSNWFDPLCDDYGTLSILSSDVLFWEESLDDKYGVSYDDGMFNWCFKSIELPFNIMPRIRALAETTCDIVITSPRENASFTIEILHWKGDPNYSSLFIDVDEETNATNVISFPFDCTATFVSKTITVHLLYIYIDIRIRAIDNSEEHSHQTDSCSIKYDQVRRYSLDYFTRYFQRNYDTYSISNNDSVTMSAYTFKVDCPEDCACSLGHKELIRTCDDDILMKTYIVCDPNLVGLSFSNKNLDAILSGAFLCYNSLLKLILSQNDISTLPKDIFTGLEKLRYLDLSYNKLESLENGTFDNQVHLKYLFLQNNKIHLLSESLFNSLFRVLYLSLSDNKITTYPKHVFALLSDTKRLDLSSNQLPILTDASFQMQQIQILKIDHNKLSTITPAAFANLTLLRELDLGHNDITYFDSSLFRDLTNLKYLLIYANLLRTLPDDIFEGLNHLELIYALYNELDDFPFLGEGTSFLYFGYNRFKTLRDGVFNSTSNLKVLDLQFNSLEYLPYRIFDGLDDLNRLTLYSNNLKSLPSLKIKGLVELYLENNDLRLLQDGTFNGTSALQKLDLRLNKLDLLKRSMFSGLINLKSVWLGFNEVVELSGSVFLYLTNTNKLTLNANKLKYISVDAFNGMTYLVYLDISDNNLKELPSDIFAGMNLFYLYMFSNGIFTFPSTSSLLYLTELGADENRFVVLPNDCFASTLLTHISLFGNYIEQLPHDLFHHSSNIIYISFAYNQIQDLPHDLFHSAININEIIFAHNRISHLPQDLFKSNVKLAELSMGYNYLTTLPVDLFKNNIELIEIVLDHNYLTHLPIGIFENLRKLNFLQLASNRLSTLPDGTFTSNIALEWLVLDNNKLGFLHTLPEGLFHSLGRLEQLLLENNQLEHLPSSFDTSLAQLLLLKCEFNDISHLSPDMFHMKTKLLLVNLKRNKISNLHVDIFVPLTALQSLHLAYNMLTELPSFVSCKNLKFLFANHNNITKLYNNSFETLTNLKSLSLQNNNIDEISVETFHQLSNLMHLVLSSNNITKIEPRAFETLHNLRTLKLSHNYLSDFVSTTFSGLDNLIVLSLDNNSISNFGTQLLENFNNLKDLNLSHNNIQTVQLDSVLPQHVSCNLRRNPLNLITSQSFVGVSNMTVFVDKYATCCFKSDNITCLPEEARSSFLTYRRLLINALLRVVVWTVGLAAVVFNIAVVGNRIVSSIGNEVQNTLIVNLAVSDFLMGVDMVILASVDLYYGDYFPSYSEKWINGFLCKTASVLSTLSSEASVGLVTLIGLDRFLCISYPFGVNRGLGNTRMKICVSFCWLLSIIVAIVPVIVQNHFPEFYDISEVCIGIPIVRRKVTFESESFLQEITYGYHDGLFFKHLNYDDSSKQGFVYSVPQRISYSISTVSGHELANYVSIVVFIGLNLVCFIALAIFYIRIFQIAQESSNKTKSSSKRQEVRMALKMSGVVLTDFVCWVPLALVCLFVQCGVLTVGPKVHAWAVGFILPINSSLNPFLYTLACVIAEYYEKNTENKK